MAKPNEPKSKYSGILKTPILSSFNPRGTILTGPVPEEIWQARQDEVEKKYSERFLERVVALFEHYDVPVGDFTTLALELAGVHVPGFRLQFPGEKTRVGRPTRVTPENLWGRIEQFREILALAHKCGGVKRACAILSEKPQSACFGEKPATLRKWVTDANSAQGDKLNHLSLLLAQGLLDVAALEGGDKIPIMLSE